MLKNEIGSIVAMSSNNRKNLSGMPSLIIEGVAIDPLLHGKGAYGKILSEMYNGEATICFRTQNPRLYAAHEMYCHKVYPGVEEMPGAIKEIQKALASELKCAIDKNGVVKGYYGSLFYGKEPFHERISPFFKEILEMDLYKGDAVLVVGVK